MSVSTQFLHTIQPVSEDRPAEAVAREILVLIRSEYRYTIADLCRMFCCERQWIEDFFVPNIRHIHVNHFFMSYIIQQFADRLTPFLAGKCVCRRQVPDRRSGRLPG